MAQDLVPAADAYDFSKYQTGDVICIPLREVVRRGEAGSIMLMAAIANAATRANLDWEVSRDYASDELRVSFK